MRRTKPIARSRKSPRSPPDSREKTPPPRSRFIRTAGSSIPPTAATIALRFSPSSGGAAGSHLSNAFRAAGKHPETSPSIRRARVCSRPIRTAATSWNSQSTSRPEGLPPGAKSRSWHRRCVWCSWRPSKRFLRSEGARQSWTSVECFGMQADVLLSRGLLRAILLHPRFPAFPGGGVFAGEGKGSNVGIGDGSFFVAALGIEAHGGIGESLSGAAVEDVALDLLAGFQRDGDVAPIVKGLFEGETNFFVGGKLRNPAFQIFALASRRDFELFGIGDASLGYAHLLL